MSLLAGIAIVKPTFAEGTALYLNPVLNGPGNFSVDIMIADVVNLYGYQFRLYYDPAVVMATDIAVGPFIGSYFLWNLEIGPNYAALGVTKPLGTAKGETGSGILATITFNGGTGGSYLLLQDDKLTNPRAQLIDHTTSGGYYSSVMPPVFEGYLCKRRNWNRPEHNLFKISTDGTSMWLGIGVGNGGTGNVLVKAVWKVIGPEGIEYLEKEEVIPPGEQMLTHEYGAEVGSYAVELQMWYDSDGDYVVDTIGGIRSGDGLGGTSYEFTVVP